MIAFCAAFALLSTVTDSSLHWWGLWIFIGLSAVMVKTTIWTYAVISRFQKARGLALALALTGTAVTGMVAPVLANSLIQNFGWRWAYFGVAAAYCAVALPLIALFFYSARELPSARNVDTRDVRATPALEGLTIKLALRSGAFWKIALATFLIMFPLSGTVVHLVPALTHGGLARSSAVVAASVTGVAAVGGRLLAGFLLDRMDAKILAGCAFALPAVTAMALLWFNGEVAMAIAIALVLGTTAGAELEMSSYLSSRHFGLRNFGALFGFIAGLIALAGGAGPVLGGLAYDVYQTYDMAWIGAAIMALIASALIFSLPPYPKTFPADQAE